MIALSLYDLLAARSNQAPDAVAISAPGRSPLTFARLCVQVRDVVSTLHSIGIGRNDRVAVVLSDGPEAVVAILGVAAAATCAPLDSRCRRGEFEASLLGLAAKAVIVRAGSQSTVIDVARQHGIALLELAPALEEKAGVFALSGTGRCPDAGGCFAHAGDIAFVLHTSGTTGPSKLVPLTHANIIAATQRVQAALGLSRGDRYLNVTPLRHSQGIMLTLSSILAGGSTVCTPGLNPELFFEWLAESRPTWYSAAPAVHQSVLAQSLGKPDLANRYRFRFIRSAGAPLPSRVRDQLESLFHSPVIDAYGMTECYPITSGAFPPATHKPGSVGVAAGTEIAVVNQAGDSFPVRETGEIVVRGPHVTRGYLNEQPEDGPHFSRGWFRTGDLGYLDADGYLFITGRIKDIINRGGEKISPCEIDGVLMDHPDVSEAVTFALPHPTLGEDVVAAVVLREHALVTERDIQAFASRSLPPFKIPRHVIFVDDIPKSATGKVRRQALAEKYASTGRREVLDTETTHRRYSDVEQRLLSMWVPLLGMTTIGIQDDFFDLGGHSLLAIQLIGQIARVFGKRLSLSALVQAPTVEQLAKLISEQTWTSEGIALVPTQPHGSKPPFFWVHGDTSSGFLASYLGPDQPLYALDHQSQDGTSARFTTVEALARQYLHEVRGVQAAGPYFLGGFSFGGTVAFEMAQQLRRTGEIVGLLVLLDSRFPGGGMEDSAESETERAFGAEVRRHLHEAALLQPRVWLSYVMVRLNDRLQSLTTRVTLKRMYCQILVRTGHLIPAWLLSEYLFGIYQKALNAYRPHLYSGRVVYVKSENRSANHQTSWAGVIGDEMACYVVPGGHLDIVTQPYAHSWADKLKDWLGEAQGDPSVLGPRVGGTAPTLDPTAAHDGYGDHIDRSSIGSPRTLR